ncbi:hypothetical protein QYE76_010816 [Lolium multiflorum]|uniref:AP2/ERF domain-containing protein n=1 Tax=Lolium multiflorum TaxID=4521 RepID=A0AAD8PSR9_LOLMU|nr:hypothetical protein QYE76_008115 [Lolium multiflorum]KAK1694119.1 hypothetical protein QYE76_010816 [Lolium multiflorum]
MPPRRRSSSGYRGVRAHPNGTFYAEIWSGEERIGLAYIRWRTRRRVPSDERLRLEWAWRFPEDLAVEVSVFAEKAKMKAAQKAVKKKDREARRAKKEAKKKKEEEKAAGRKDEKKKGADSSTIIVDSSSSEFEWSSTPVSSTTTDSSELEWSD